MRIFALLLTLFGMFPFQEKSISPAEGTFVIYVNDFNNQKFFWLHFKAERSLPKEIEFVDVLRKEGSKEILDIRVKPEILSNVMKMPLFPIENSSGNTYFVYILDKNMNRTHEVEIRVLKNNAGFLVNQENYIVGPLIDQY